MPKENPTFRDRQYGVVIGTARDGLLNPVDRSRYEIKLDCNDDIYFRVSAKVASVANAEIRAYFSPSLTTVTKYNVPALANGKPGFRPLETGMQIGEGLDYLRDGLFPLPDMQHIGADPTGLSLTNLLDAVVQRAIHTDGARLVAFGHAFKNDRKPDSIFHHSPSWGMHDVHMMQGDDAAPHNAHNRVYGDGAVFAWFPSERQLIALFIHFEHQQLRTDQEGRPAAALWHRPAPGP